MKFRDYLERNDVHIPDIDDYEVYEDGPRVDGTVGILIDTKNRIVQIL